MHHSGDSLQAPRVAVVRVRITLHQASPPDARVQPSACRVRSPVRERTPPEVREQRERERELKELDRDIRTVFAYNLPLRADEARPLQVLLGRWPGGGRPYHHRPQHAQV